MWKLAKVKPIYKKGERHKPSNYRPISLTCITSKLFEQIISSDIHEYLDRQQILCDAQHGFRKARSCETQLVFIYDELARNKENKLVTDVLILDFSKAFDAVCHTKLLFKLQKLGIRSSFLSWIGEFLNNRKQFVVVDGVCSKTCNVVSGVPQGSVLGPLLFLLYINDLPQHLESQCRLFADDAVIYNTRNNNLVLSKDLQTLEKWSQNWQLSFNPAKCSVLSIGEKDSTQSYYLCNTKMQNVNTHSYLGVELSYNLKFDKHIDKITSKANRLIGMLSRVLKHADTKTKLIAYKTLVRSNLEYACQVWDPYLKKNIKKLEKIQNKSLKFIYRIKSHTSYSKLRQNTNLSSLKNRRKECRAKLFCRALETGVIKNPMEAPSKKHNTRQREMFYLPSITSATYFNSFWPRTMRDLRGE